MTPSPSKRQRPRRTPTRRLSRHAAAALSLAALLCWGLALWLPLARVEKLGLVKQGRLLELGKSFRGDEQVLLGLLVEALAIALPCALFLLLPTIALARLLDGAVPGSSLALRACAFAKQWAMPEVFALSLLVAFLKLGSLANASIASGFYFLLAAVLLLTFLLQGVPLPQTRPRKNHASAGAFLAAACILLVPANILPIMTVATPRGSTDSTLIGGVANLAGNGLWGIAAIVFVASILVPFAKIGGLLWLLRLSRRPRPALSRGIEQQPAPLPSVSSPRPSPLQTHRILDFVGRWSMLDVFLIGVLASLIDFGRLASIQPGPAVPAFAAAVVLTMLAFQRFDVWSLPENVVLSRATRDRRATGA